MTDLDLAAGIASLRPWWWPILPWAYVLVLEDYLREVIEELEDERQTVVQLHYRK